MRILVIEDEKEILKFLKPSLESECFAVDTALDGEEGLYLAKTNNYDLIILDNMLPKKNGLEVCSEFRMLGKTTPIIVLSALVDTGKKIELLNAGADDYLTKPFSFQELLARIKTILRRPEKIADDIIMIDDLVLDSRRNIVTRESEEIHLTRKEFVLLEYLMRNQGSVLSRGMIMEHVWDMNADPFSNTIEAHILSLRKKIKTKEKQKELIQTVAGRGYKIDL